MSGKKWNDIRSVELYIRGAFALHDLKIDWASQEQRIRARDYLMHNFDVNKGMAYRIIRTYRDARGV